MSEELINIDKKIDTANKELMKQMNLALSHGAMSLKELCAKASMCNKNMHEFVDLMHNQVDSVEDVTKLI